MRLLLHAPSTKVCSAVLLRAGADPIYLIQPAGRAPSPPTPSPPVALATNANSAGGTAPTPSPLPLSLAAAPLARRRRLLAAAGVSAAAVLPTGKLHGSRHRFSRAARSPPRRRRVRVRVTPPLLPFLPSQGQLQPNCSPS